MTMWRVRSMPSVRIRFVFEPRDVVADAARAELAEAGQVLPDLRGVQMKARRQLVRRDGSLIDRLEEREAAQINGQPARGQFRNSFAVRYRALGHNGLSTQQLSGRRAGDVEQIASGTFRARGCRSSRSPAPRSRMPLLPPASWFPQPAPSCKGSTPRAGSNTPKRYW